jgi:uncharacterized protein (DUF983 family)
MDNYSNIKKLEALKRGFTGSCPKCGKSKLFESYLKQVEMCNNCGTKWVNVRADDGPAWASMLVSGHLLAPFFCLIILPRIKGFFIALIWSTDAPTS